MEENKVATQNQCDGCRRGLPINASGNHNNPDSDWDLIGCTAHLYAPNSPELTRLSGEQAEERTAREGRLRELAEMATPGPWRLVKRLKNSQNPSVGTDDYEVATCWQKTLPLINGHVPRNAEYIAAANPQAILELLSECSRLASRNEQLVKEANSYAEVISYISEIVNGTPECHYLVIADDVQRMRDRLASRVEELEKCVAGLSEWLAAMSTCPLETCAGCKSSTIVAQQLAKRVLAVAHAEEKE